MFYIVEPKFCQLRVLLVNVYELREPLNTSVKGLQTGSIQSAPIRIPTLFENVCVVPVDVVIELVVMIRNLG